MCVQEHQENTTMKNGKYLRKQLEVASFMEGPNHVTLEDTGPAREKEQYSECQTSQLLSP